MAKKNRRSDGLVWSTDTTTDWTEPENSEQTPEPKHQILHVQKSVKGRGGKTATIVLGFQGNADDLDALCKTLKTKLGVGGAAKDGEILIQGDFLARTAEVLRGLGYRVKGA